MKMRWGYFVTTICLICVCYGQKYDTSDASTLNANPHSRTSCGGCDIYIHVFFLEWFHQAYTHVAATIVKVVNNATNATLTSTIQGSSFTLPESARYGAARTVPDSVITTIMDGAVYTLTYPTTYQGVGGIESYSRIPITNANGTVKCVVSKAAMTHARLLHTYFSNGLDTTPYIDERCQINMASPPQVLVRVSSLTATTTNYVDRPEARTPSAKKALPSNSLSPPTAPQTESSRPENRPTTVLASPPPRKTADLPSITPSFASSEPVHSELLGLVPSATTLKATGSREAEPAPSEPVRSDSLGSVPPATPLIATGNRGAEPAPSEPVHVHSDSLGSVPPAITLIATGNREAETVPSEPINSGSLGPVPPAITRIATGDREAETVPSEPIHSGSLGPVPTAITRIATGGRDAEQPTKTGTPDQPQELDNVNPASRPRGEPTPTVPVSQSPTKRPVFGTTETVALSSDSSLPIGLSSIVNPTDSFPISDRIRLVVTDPTSLGLPELITNKPRPTSLLPPLPSIQKTITNPQEFIVPNPSHFFLSGTTEIHRGGSTIIASGTRSISLGNSATIIIVDDSSTTPLAVNKPRPTSLLPPLPSIQKTFTNPQEFIVPNPSHFFLSGTTEIHRGGSTIITSGPRSISLGNSASIIIVDDSSATPLAVNKPRPTSLLPPLPSLQKTFTNPQEFIVANPSHFFLSGTTEIHRGGSTIITSGTRSISLGNSATIIIVDDSSTTPLAVNTVGTFSQLPVPRTQVITSNYTSALPPAATDAAGNRSEVFPGGQTKLAEVPMLIMFGATFLGIAAPWGLRYV